MPFIRSIALTLALAPPACAQDGLPSGEYIVEDIAQGGVIDTAKTSLGFAEGGVAGLAACNNYTASYQVDGNALTIGPAAATRKMCPEALMNQEQAFMDALGRVTRYDIDETGALLLFGDASEEPLLTARASG